MSVSLRHDWPDLWFLRHGQTEWNAAGRIQGRLDSPLTAMGRLQAQMQAGLVGDALGEVAAGRGGIYVSPLGRARQTAAIALAGHPVIIDPRLAEIGAGAWEGRQKADLPQRDNDLLTYTSAPQGETLEQLIARVQGFADSLAGPGIVVAHGLWGQVLRGLTKGLEPGDMGAQDNGQGCIYHLSQGRETRLDAPD
ncbi:histidine phosphatase family protein [Roseovarius sp. M141]|uniref:histidine phosphatase family protein n=1 Tax=Roseovarius sp. M141 TaxID=2583806 RepID=UPI0020CE16BE|nr:histidine phosphatase family protein [Roseovarius sp. M141]MCQ0093209.1 histidine phosphatase family protein [Roseovarius sp. M141]